MLIFWDVKPCGTHHLHLQGFSYKATRRYSPNSKIDKFVFIFQYRFQECPSSVITGASGLQFEINRKRDSELAKLRKLLEDVHFESEETANLLRKKHQEIVIDFQDQIDQLAKSRAR